jgi:hypothetical protein
MFVKDYPGVKFTNQLVEGSHVLDGVLLEDLFKILLINAATSRNRSSNLRILRCEDHEGADINAQRAHLEVATP